MSELKKIATRDGFGEEILKLGLENPEILIVDADIGKSCKTGAFRKELSAEYHDDKNQYVNVGIAEQNFSGAAVNFCLVAVGIAFSALKIKNFYLAVPMCKNLI